MNDAQKIAKLHLDRDQQIFNHVCEKVDEFLKDDKWLLTKASHTRHDDGIIRYSFEINNFIQDFVDDDERQWVGTDVKNRLAKHYYERGFEASFTSVDELMLKVNINELEEDEASGHGGPTHV